MFKNFVCDYVKNEFTLVDDDFETTIIPENDDQFFVVMVGKEYAKRQLNVAKNIILFSEFYNKANILNLFHDLKYYLSLYTASVSVKEMEEFFEPYMEDIKKYMVLM